MSRLWKESSAERTSCRPIFATNPHTGTDGHSIAEQKGLSNTDPGLEGRCDQLFQSDGFLGDFTSCTSGHAAREPQQDRHLIRTICLGISHQRHFPPRPRHRSPAIGSFLPDGYRPLTWRALTTRPACSHHRRALQTTIVCFC